MESNCQQLRQCNTVESITIKDLVSSRYPLKLSAIQWNVTINNWVSAIQWKVTTDNWKVSQCSTVEGTIKHSIMIKPRAFHVVWSSATCVSLPMFVLLCEPLRNTGFFVLLCHSHLCICLPVFVCQFHFISLCVSCLSVALSLSVFLPASLSTYLCLCLYFCFSPHSPPMYLTWACVCRLEDVLDDSYDNKLVLSITMY